MSARFSIPPWTILQSDETSHRSSSPSTSIETMEDELEVSISLGTTENASALNSFTPAQSRKRKRQLQDGNSGTCAKIARPLKSTMHGYGSPPQKQLVPHCLQTSSSQTSGLPTNLPVLDLTDDDDDDDGEQLPSPIRPAKISVNKSAPPALPLKKKLKGPVASTPGKIPRDQRARKRQSIPKVKSATTVEFVAKEPETTMDSQRSSKRLPGAPEDPILISSDDEANSSSHLPHFTTPDSHSPSLPPPAFSPSLLLRTAMAKNPIIEITDSESDDHRKRSSTIPSDSPPSIDLDTDIDADIRDFVLPPPPPKSTPRRKRAPFPLVLRIDSDEEMDVGVPRKSPPTTPIRQKAPKPATIRERHSASSEITPLQAPDISKTYHGKHAMSSLSHKSAAKAKDRDVGSKTHDGSASLEMASSTTTKGPRELNLEQIKNSLLLQNTPPPAPLRSLLDETTGFGRVKGIGHPFTVGLSKPGTIFGSPTLSFSTPTQHRGKKVSSDPGHATSSSSSFKEPLTFGQPDHTLLPPAQLDSTPGRGSPMLEDNGEEPNSQALQMALDQCMDNCSEKYELCYPP